jgi:hypothetical protein
MTLANQQERFSEACKTDQFTPHTLAQGPNAGYLIWEVRHVQNGERVTIDGPFITEEEARVSADLLRGTFRGARAYQAICNRVWNYSPDLERLQHDQALMSRDLLAIRLGVTVPAIQK